jgi:hypothetical protein
VSAAPPPEYYQLFLKSCKQVHAQPDTYQGCIKVMKSNQFEGISNTLDAFVFPGEEMCGAKYFSHSSMPWAENF